MKIAFISPKFKIVNRNESFKEYLTNSDYMYFYNIFWSGFSNGLLILAALTPHDFELKYIDENYENIPFKEKFDIIAITATTQQAKRAYQIAEELKNIWGREIIVAIGVSHVNLLPEEAGNYCDVIFIGEAENSWPAFLSDFKRGGWENIYNADDYDPIDLTKIPVPRYDLLNPDCYKMIWIQTSRGCPRNCEFCSATKFFGRKYRTKSEEQVIKEITAAREFLKFQQILFSDDNMFLHRDRSISLLKKFKSLNISFVAQADISIGQDREFLEMLKEYGCSILFIGFESLDVRNLALMNKSKWKMNQLSNYPAYIRNIIQAGIGVYGAFILGYDWDTRSSFRDIIKFIKDNYLAGAQITLLTHLPGTDLRKRYINEGRILNTEWENYTFFDVNIKHPKLSKKEIEEELLNIYRSIYNKEYLEKKNRYYKKIFQDKLKKELAK